MKRVDDQKEVTKEQLADSFRNLAGGAARAGQVAFPSSPSAVAILTVAAVVTVFAVGYMRGRRKSSVIEIKRI